MMTVVVPTRNRAALLEKMIQSLADQLVAQEAELIIVDNGSSDDTPRVASSWQARLPACLVVTEPRPGLHHARHAGLRASRGELLLFADDDIRATPTWLASVSESFRRDASVALVGGPVHPDYQTSPPPWVEGLWETAAHGRYLAAFSVVDLGQVARTIGPRLVFGCNFGIRKTVLLQAGGFHPDGMPPDRVQYRGDGETAVADWTVAHGLKTHYEPGAAVHHLVSAERLTLEYVYKRGFEQGVASSFSAVRREMTVAGPWVRLQKVARQLKLRSHPWRAAAEALSPRRSGRAAWRRGIHDGYCFHRRAMDTDPSVRAWVARPNYLD
jgi:glucosyl-dolichyl phosphate glucuronosyltransferase